MSVKANQTRTLHRGRVFKLNKESLTLRNGVDVDLEVIRHPGAAAVVALKEGDRIVLIRQFRYAVGGDVLEIPAGTLEKGEDPISCARRELAEETGYAGMEWEKLGEITPVPGYSDECVHLFLAKQLRPSKQNLDRDELIEVLDFPIDHAVRMIFSGEIQDAKSIAGLMLAARRMGSLSIAGEANTS